MRVGEGENLTESGVRDELSDIDGRSYGWKPRVKFNECVSHGLFKLMVEIISVNTVSVILNHNLFLLDFDLPATSFVRLCIFS